MDLKEFRERYQYDSVKDQLGQGAFGRVFRARDLLLDRWVALKIFSRDVPERYDLISEIRRAIDLYHPNICRYYGAEVLRGSNALGEAQEIQVGVMEFVEGGTVEEFLKRNPHHRKKLLGDVLRGLSYLHGHRPPIIHRDLKPPNVLVGFEDGTPVAKITDFGISKQINQSGARVSMVGLGTYAYMAPEQLNPDRFGVNGKIQCNLDLWAFGAMTIELLTGELPFGGNEGDSTGQIMEAIIRGIPPQALNGFEEPYRSLLARCMIQDARHRAQTADELLSLLESPTPIHAEPRRQTVVEEVWSKPVTAPSPVQAPRLEPVLSEPEPGAARVARWVWGALAVVALVAAFAVWRLSQPQSQLALSPIPSPQADSQQEPAQNPISVPRQPSNEQKPSSVPAANSGPSAQQPPAVNPIRAVDALYEQKQYAEAAPLYEQSCANGNASDCNRLGDMYANGRGVARNDSRAVNLFSRACDLGNALGCSNFGDMYSYGLGVEKNTDKAVQFLAKGCNMGDSFGCRRLHELQ